VRWIAQMLPFQTSTRACPFGSAVLTENPVATHRRAAGQDRPDRKLFRAPGTAGMGWSAQVLPFHRSASGR
jgi:hypothetical protein